MSTSRLSLVQQIAELDAPAPVDFDIENIQGNAPEESLEDAFELSGAREHYLDVGPSSLRKLQPSVSDPKYEGVKISRKELLEDSDQESGEESEDDPSSEEEEDAEDDEDADMDDQAPSESESEDNEPETPRESPVEDLSSTLRKTRGEDRKKGQAVSRQLAVWDTLLDARIGLQKSVLAANRLPSPSDLSQLSANEDYQNSLRRMLEEASLLSEQLFILEENLLKANGHIAAPPRKRRRVSSDEDEKTSRGYDDELREATQTASALEHSLHPYLVQTLNKWSAKIQAVAPSVLLPSNRNAFSKKSHNLKSAVQLIDENMTDHDKLLARTRVWRGKGVRLGRRRDEDETDEPEKDIDVEIFDDTDFYQQVLRDVIDAQGGKGGEDWMTIQKQKKAKKKVDTKASKGRKIRYEVHEKLQNFMVPVPVVGAWHEEQVDELFASLLGKGFENALDDSGSSAAMNVDLGDALKGGFRVF